MSEPANLDDAFSLVANETRFDILQALWDAEGVIPFSELHELVDVRDSGQFNYHLGKLTPEFVREREEGYELTYAGTRVIGAAVSGAYTDAEATSVDPIPVDDCPKCESTIEASYEEGYMTLECADCDVTITNLAAPPIVAASQDPEELPMAFHRYTIGEVQTMNAGFCSLCNGPVQHSVTRLSGGDDTIGDDRLDVTVECGACGMETHAVIGAIVVDHPAVVSFLHDQGIDLREEPIWELDWLFEPHASVESEDPVRVVVEITYDDDRLELTLDGDLDVIEYERD
jgi:hypothetical protein